MSFFGHISIIIYLIANEYMAEKNNYLGFNFGNFSDPINQNTGVSTKYLNLQGLTDFWTKVKTYIDEQDECRNGQNIPLYPKGAESNISITAAITDINEKLASIDTASTIPYGYCSTWKENPNKEVTTSIQFKLETGARISVRFSYDHTEDYMTLNVNNTGPKLVYLNCLDNYSQISVGPGIIFKDIFYDFIYNASGDGQWELLPGIHNMTGSSNDDESKLYLIGASTQKIFGAPTYSNQNVYTQGGAIYTNNGFYDESGASGASVHKAIVPKDYTMYGGYTRTEGISVTASVPLVICGALVSEHFTYTYNETPIELSSGYTRSRSLYITLTVTNDNIFPINFRFVRFIIKDSTPVINTGDESASVTYNVYCKHGTNGSLSEPGSHTFTINPNSEGEIGKVSMIYDVFKNIVIDDTDNGTDKWGEKYPSGWS